MSEKRVLITGGAGFLGINLVRHLLARGYEVTSFDPLDFDYPERSRIREVRGDIRDAAAVDEAMKGQNFVVHTAAALPLYTPEDIYTTDVVGTRVVMGAARRHGVERAVHISSTAVYGIPDHHPLCEDDRLDGVGPYGQARSRRRSCASRNAPGGSWCPSSGPSPSSVQSGSGSLLCSTTGPSMARTSL